MMKIVGKIFKYFFICVIIAVFILFLYRVNMMNDPREATVIMPSEAMKEIYSQNGDIEVKTQLMVNETLSSDGRFYTTGLMIFPETDELVITIRYNDSTLKALAEQYELGEIDTSKEYFEYSLLDSEGNRYYPDETESFRNWRYSYRRMRFSGVDTEKYNDFAVCMYYVGDIDYSKDAFGSVFAYYYEWELIDAKLTKDDRKLLAE